MLSLVRPCYRPGSSECPGQQEGEAECYQTPHTRCREELGAYQASLQAELSQAAQPSRLAHGGPRAPPLPPYGSTFLGWTVFDFELRDLTGKKRAPQEMVGQECHLHTQKEAPTLQVAPCLLLPGLTSRAHAGQLHRPKHRSCSGCKPGHKPEELSVLTNTHVLAALTPELRSLATHEASPFTPPPVPGTLTPASRGRWSLRLSFCSWMLRSKWRLVLRHLEFESLLLRLSVPAGKQSKKYA